MNAAASTALKGGFLIGLANLAWLYVAYYLGLHTSGIWVFQVFMLIWLAVSLTGYILALKAVRRHSERWGYWSGLRAGFLAAFVSMLMSVVAQAGYFKVVHPEWPEVMMGQTRGHFAGQGMAAARVEQMVAQARAAFTLQNYALQSAFAALFVGIVFSAIIMIFLRRRKVAVG